MEYLWNNLFLKGNLFKCYVRTFQSQVLSNASNRKEMLEKNYLRRQLVFHQTNVRGDIEVFDDMQSMDNQVRQLV